MLYIYKNKLNLNNESDEDESLGAFVRVCEKKWTRKRKRK